MMVFEPADSEAALSDPPAPEPGRRRSRFNTKQELVQALLRLPADLKHEEAARALGLSDRQLYRLRERLGVLFPLPQFPLGEGAPAGMPTGSGKTEAGLLSTHAWQWVIGYTVAHTAVIAAATVDEALSIIRARQGPNIQIHSIQRTQRTNSD